MHENVAWSLCPWSSVRRLWKLFEIEMSLKASRMNWHLCWSSWLSCSKQWISQMVWQTFLQSPRQDCGRSMHKWCLGFWIHNFPCSLYNWQFRRFAKLPENSTCKGSGFRSFAPNERCHSDSLWLFRVEEHFSKWLRWWTCPATKFDYSVVQFEPKQVDQTKKAKWYLKRGSTFSTVISHTVNVSLSSCHFWAKDKTMTTSFLRHSKSWT